MIKIECPCCEHLTLPFVQPETVCENYQEAFVADYLKSVWPDTFPDKIRPFKVFRHLENVVYCGKCHSEAMIFHKDLERWLCFGCYRTWQDRQLKFCEYCKFHRTLDNFHLIDACNLCWEYYMNYDEYKSDKSPRAWMLKKFNLNKDKIFW